MVKFCITKSPSQTKKLGEYSAKKLFRYSPKRKKALIIALEGDLGGGKTTFLQGFAKGLGVRERILSPTFVIIKRFKVKDLTTHQKLRFGTGQGFKNFYHIDCYRIRKPKELLDLGFEEIISNPKNIVAIEWAEKIKKFLPANTLFLKFEFVDKLKRKIVIKW